MKKEMRLTGNLLYYDQKNLNNRIYTKETAEKIVEQFNKMKEESGGVFGELGYQSEENFIGINLLNRSHEIEEIHIDESQKALVGTIKVLDSPKGNIVKELYDPKNMVGLSCRPRGTGTVNENGEIEDFEIISFDLVSGKDAFANIKENDHLILSEDE